MAPDDREPWPALLARHARALLCITRLHQPADLALLLLPGLWGLWLAADGPPPVVPLAAYLIGATAIRCAGWVFNDLAEPRLLPTAPESCVAKGLIPAPEALWLFTALCFVAFVCAVTLGRGAVIWAPLVWAMVVGFPFIKRFTLLSQIYLGLGYALTIPMAYIALGRLPARAGWLYFTAELLLATAALTLHAIPRRVYEARVGVGSLPQLFGRGVQVVIGTLQAGGLAALWLAGRAQELGDFHLLAVAVAAALVVHQHGLLPRIGGAIAAYRVNIWLGVAVLAGIAFDYHCRCAGAGG